MLGQKVQPYKTRLYNPFSGAIKRLRANIPNEQVASVTVMMFPSLMVFTSNHQNTIIRWADEGIVEGSRPVFGEGWYTLNDFVELWSMTSYAGDVFIADRYGSVLSTMPAAAHGDV